MSAPISEPVIARYALRTFGVDTTLRVLRPVNRRLSRHMAPDAWRDGECVAVCGRSRGHAAPADGCTCGIYGVNHLAAVGYGMWSRWLLTVIAAEGETIRGSDGLRTAAARVVGYWIAPDAPSSIAEIATEQLREARRFTDIDAMIAAFGLRATAPPPPPGHTVGPQRRIDPWRLHAALVRSIDHAVALWITLVAATLGWMMGGAFRDVIAAADTPLATPVSTGDSFAVRIITALDAALVRGAQGSAALNTALMVGVIAATIAVTRLSLPAAPTVDRTPADKGMVQLHVATVIRLAARAVLPWLAAPLAFLIAHHHAVPVALIVAAVITTLMLTAVPTALVAHVRRRATT